MNFQVKNQSGFIGTLLRNKTLILIIALFLLHVFLRFYSIETKSIFRWDQVDSAWAAKHIVVDHQFPLVGPENKQGSGVFIGPLYYYIVSFFYFLTNMDPIAAGLLAGVSSVVGFFVLYFVTKRMFSTKVALIALFINTVAFSSIDLERVQWEVNFIPALFLLAFYFLYRILSGNEKSIIYLAIVSALAFHAHLTTAVFFPIIMLCALPFFPRNKKTLRYGLLSIPIVLVGLAPIIIANIITGNSQVAESIAYANLSFHGVHLARIMQLLPTAFVQIESFLILPILKPVSFLLLPIFFIVYFLNIPTRKKFTVVALASLSFIVPLLVLSTYSGEITNYYYSMNRFVGLIIIAYLICKILELRNKIITLLIVILACLYAYTGIHKFLTLRVVGLQNYRSYVKDYVKNSKVIKFEHGSPFSYVYYFYTRKK